MIERTVNIYFSREDRSFRILNLSREKISADTKRLIRILNS